MVKLPEEVSKAWENREGRKETDPYTLTTKRKRKKEGKWKRD